LGKLSWEIEEFTVQQCTTKIRKCAMLGERERFIHCSPAASIVDDGVEERERERNEARFCFPGDSNGKEEKRSAISFAASSSNFPSLIFFLKKKP